MEKGSAIGLDVGTSSVKLVEVEKNKNIKVVRFGIFPLPAGVLSGGVVTRPQEVGNAIRHLIQETRTKSKRAVVAIAGQSVIVRHLKMPYMTHDELANAIRWEAERYIPFSIDEVSMDVQIIEEDQNLNEIEVMLVCAHNDIVYSHLRAMDDAGVLPLAMDIQPFALMRAMGMEDTKQEGITALLDIGAGTTDLTIIKSGVPRFTRIIPVAGSNMTTNISEQLNIDFKEAEQNKLKYGDALYDFENSTDELEAKINYSLQTNLKELALELRRSFDYYRLQQRNEEIKELVISGGGSKLKNLIPFLKQELDVHVMLSNNRAGVNYANNIRDEFEDKFPVFTVALGLALREVTKA